MDLDLLWVGAFRYYIGRMTISVHHFCEVLVECWDDLPKKAKILIEKELLREISEDDLARLKGDRFRPLGQDVDSKEWRRVYEEISKKSGV